MVQSEHAYPLYKKDRKDIKLLIVALFVTLLTGIIVGIILEITHTKGMVYCFVFVSALSMMFLTKLYYITHNVMYSAKHNEKVVNVLHKRKEDIETETSAEVENYKRIAQQEFDNFQNLKNECKIVVKEKEALIADLKRQIAGSQKNDESTI